MPPVKGVSVASGSTTTEPNARERYRWCGVVWCGVVWCGVVWCGVVWCGVVWCGVVWCGVVWCEVPEANFHVVREYRDPSLTHHWKERYMNLC